VNDHGERQATATTTKKDNKKPPATESRRFFFMLFTYVVGCAFVFNYPLTTDHLPFAAYWERGLPARPNSLNSYSLSRTAPFPKGVPPQAAGVCLPLPFVVAACPPFRSAGSPLQLQLPWLWSLSLTNH
jgi:hypothetical protein